jgi:hypothetical protein
MRKTTVGFVISIATIGFNAAAQNTFPTSGNVGIGTMSPSSLFSVGSSSQFAVDGSGNLTAAGTKFGSLLVQAPVAPGYTLLDNSAEAQIGLASDSGQFSEAAGLNDVILRAVTATSGGNLILSDQNPTGNIVFTTGGLGSDSLKMVLLTGGNVGIGTGSPGAKLEVDGNVKLTSGSGASITFFDGTVQSTAYTGVTCGGDYAESVDVAGTRANYEPGDVLVIGPDSGSDVIKSSEPYSTLVTGVYSTKPGVVGRRQTTTLKSSNTEVPMAMVGVVPTKVSAENGPIKVGDLLVSASMAGYAMKGTDRSKILGAVIGKAMGNLNADTGVIEVLVTLQ